MKVQLKKTLRHKGKEYTELDIPLEELTGLDLIEVEKNNIDLDDRKALIIPEYSKTYLIAVAARALHMPVEVLRTLSARDFTAVAMAVQNFLTGSDSGTNEEPSEDDGHGAHTNSRTTGAPAPSSGA